MSSVCLWVSLSKQGSCCLGRFFMSVASYPARVQDPGDTQEPVPAPSVSKSLLLGTGIFTAWTTCIHLICSWCRACFFPQHLPPGHMPRYPKLFLLKSRPLLRICVINAIQGPRWGNSTGANTCPPARTCLRSGVHTPLETRASPPEKRKLLSEI